MSTGEVVLKLANAGQILVGYTKNWVLFVQSPYVNYYIEVRLSGAPIKPPRNKRGSSIRAGNQFQEPSSD